MKTRAFVRYSKKGKIVPGSLILTSGSYPHGSSLWKEVPADLCCESGVKRVFIVPGGFPISIPNVQFFCGTGPTLVGGAITGTYTNAQELVAGLNAQLDFMGQWSVNEDGDVVLAIATNIATTLLKNPDCPFEDIIASITSFAP